jgi:2-methylisocitrate lyase-like PEP mutase family enzyme
MVDNARRITSAVVLPVVADADTGDGDQINVVRCVQECDRAGVAAIHIEEQMLPKKCGHMVIARTELAGIPLLFNWVEGGKTPPLTYEEVAALGFAMIIMPIGMLLAATGAMQNFLTKLKAAGTPAPFADELMSFDDFTDLIGLREIGALEKRFSV